MRCLRQGLIPKSLQISPSVFQHGFTPIMILILEIIINSEGQDLVVLGCICC